MPGRKKSWEIRREIDLLILLKCSQRDFQGFAPSLLTNESIGDENGLKQMAHPANALSTESAIISENQNITTGFTLGLFRWNVSATDKAPSISNGGRG